MEKNNKKIPLFNLAAYAFSHKKDEETCLLFGTEAFAPFEICTKEVKEQTASFADYLKWAGVKKGDYVLASIDYVPEAVYAYLACLSIGAVWMPQAADQSAKKVRKSVKKVNPKVLIIPEHLCSELTEKNELPQNIVVLPMPGNASVISKPPIGKYWNDTFNMNAPDLEYAHFPPERAVFAKEIKKYFFSSSKVVSVSESEIYGKALEMEEKEPQLMYKYENSDLLPFFFGSVVFLFSGNPNHPNCKAVNSIDTPAT